VYDEENLFDYIDEMRESGKSWKYTRVMRSLGERALLDTIEDGSGQPIKVYVHSGVDIVPIPQLAEEEGISEQECYIRYFDRVFRDTNAQSSIRTRVMDAVKGRGDFFSIDYVPRSGRNRGQEVTLYYKGNNCDLIAWLKDIAIKWGEHLVKLEKAGTFWEGFPLNNLTKEGGVLFPQGKKPEALIKKVLELATQPGDWVLDSFAGSGTTAAVAHKMRRKWIAIELEEHCHTHIIPRLTRVIDGQDSGGITKAVKWKGGGGYRYYRLAPSLLEKDRFGNWIISKQYNSAMLAEAMCKFEGFKYAPSDTEYWMQGYSTERDFIYVTTQTLTREQLQKLSDEVGDSRSLLVCCAAFRAKDTSQFPNLTIKKIPKMVLNRCEWGRDDYSLEIRNLPQAPPPSEPVSVSPTNGRGKPMNGSMPLFEAAAEGSHSR
jgi:adenine-specific DNA-methyltransferase